MANIAKITKSSKGYSVTTTEGVREFAKVEEAFEFVNAYNAEQAAKMGGGKERQAPTGLDYRLDGTKLTITVDLAQSHGNSASGKSVIVASTHGNVPMWTRPDGRRVFVSLNAYAK